LFFTGYTYAVFNMFLMKSVPSNFYRFWVILLAFMLRYSFFIWVIDRSALKVGILIRGVLVDFFILFFFHSAELTDRKVFQSFYENREELLQFKELLADSLPLGITVFDCKALKPLFSNASFLSIFHSYQATTAETLQTGNSPRNRALDENNENNHPKNYLDLLYADETSIRDLGRDQPDLNQNWTNHNSICLKDLLGNLIKNKLFIDKALSLTASEKNQDHPRTFDITLKRIKWNGNDAIAVVLNDITHQEKLMYLKMANANKDKIIATVSHELRTPLNGIIGLLDMTEKKVQHHDALEYISLCKDNAHLLLSLVNSLLDMHQISSGKLKLNISKINIRKCLQSVIRLFQFQTNQKGISLTLSVDDNVPSHINTDENRLKQVIINLIGNAIKFTSQGSIKVTVRENSDELDYLIISVTDTGLGIHEKDMNKLFQMFGKLEDGESVNKNGVGLGLTISNALAVMLNGEKEERKIQVTSQYGKGTTFYFNILKDLKTRRNIALESLVKPGVESADESKENLHNTQTNKTAFRNKLEPERLRKNNSMEIDEITDPSISLESVNSKLARYQTFLKINISELNSQTHISHVNTKETSTHVNGHQENKISLFPSQASDRNSGRQGTAFELRKDSSPTNYIHNPEGNSYILIVDDNPFNLLVAENLVKETGYIVKTATGGHEAIKKMEEFTKKCQHVKAILMDCQMPVIDGYETSRILVEKMKNGEVIYAPILALTANNSKEDIERCHNSGMVGHLTKPTSKASLMEALAKL